MTLVLAYLAGVLTLINPCVLPVLPIVLASALQASPRGPLALAAGMSLSFITLGVTVTAFGHLVGLYEEDVARNGAVLMLGFGVALLVPRAELALERALAGLSRRADARLGRLSRTGWHGQFAGGLLLGAVWSPCIGPTLGGAIALAATGEGLGRAAAIMTAFALGVSTLVLGIGYGARGVVARGGWARWFGRRARPLLGAVFVVVGMAILLGLQHRIEALALQLLPAWLIDLSVAL